MQNTKSGKILFLIGIIYTLTVPTALVIHGSASAATITLAIGVFVTFMARLEGLSKFKVGFMEAEMKQVIEEANATLEQLRSVASSVAKSALLDSMAANFILGTPIENRLAIHDQIIESLKGVGLSDKEMSDVTDMWNRGIGMLFQMAIYHKMTGGHRSGEAKYNKVTAAMANKFQAMYDISKWKAASPQELKQFLVEHKLLTDETSQLVEDYQHFFNTRDIRSKDVFRCLDYQPPAVITQ
jgi:hypothetical protein